MTIHLLYINQHALIEGDDFYANIAYYALHKFHWPPSKLFGLPEPERAFVFAAIAVKLKKDKEEAKKAKRRKK